MALDNLNNSQKLKVTVLCDVRKIAQEVGSRFNDQVMFDKQAVELISEMVWHKLQDYGSDLELFARHGKRSTINSDDVKLLVRKNACLKDRVSTIASELHLATSGKKKKKEKESAEGCAGPSEVLETDIDMVDLELWG